MVGKGSLRVKCSLLPWWGVLLAPTVLDWHTRSSISEVRPSKVVYTLPINSQISSSILGGIMGGTPNQSSFSALLISEFATLISNHIAKSCL